jgi:hypothetical protein
MIGARHDQTDFRHLFCQHSERLDQGLQPFVGAPFTKRQNAMNRLAPSRKVWVFGTSRQYAMRTHVYPAGLIFRLQNASVCG